MGFSWISTTQNEPKVLLDTNCGLRLQTHELVVYFGHLDFDIVWNPITRTQDTIRGVDRYFGGMGEGQSYKVWQHALLASLYDAYQVYDEFNDGDTFTCTYNGETVRFICDGVHVVMP